MKELVEKVAAIIATQEAKEIGIDPSDIAEYYLEEARAAIKATLEHLSENVTEGMDRAGDKAHFAGGGYSATFKAMCLQALKEMDG